MQSISSQNLKNAHVSINTDYTTKKIMFTWNRFVAKWIGGTEEALQERSVLLVVPIAENDGEFFVILIGFV